MNRAQLIENLNVFRSEHAEAEKRAKVALAEAEALRKIIEGIEGLVNGSEAQLVIREEGTIVVHETPDAVRGDKPLGMEAVRRILIETGQSWKIAALAEEIVRRGWIVPGARNPRASVNRAIERLMKRGEVRRTAKGTYRYRMEKLPRSEEDETG